MAAHPKYAPPHEQLLELARIAREEGMPFDWFWEAAVRPKDIAVTWSTPEAQRPAGAIVWPKDSTDRNIARAATKGAKDGWRRAYEGEPATKAEAALPAVISIVNQEAA